MNQTTHLPKAVTQKNRPKKPGFEVTDEYAVWSEVRFLRCPKHTVPPPRRMNMSDTRVSQIPDWMNSRKSGDVQYDKDWIPHRNWE